MAEDGQQEQDPQDGAQEGQQEDGGKPDTDWKAEARKWEQRAKRNDTAARENAAAAKKLADIEAANQTAQERAEAAARQAEERAQAALKRAAVADVRSAFTEAGIPNAAAIVGRLDISQVLGENGEADPDAVAALVEDYKPFVPPSGPRAPGFNPAQGNSAPALSLAQMIADAERAGDTRKSMRLKARYAREQRNQG